MKRQSLFLSGMTIAAAWMALGASAADIDYDKEIKPVLSKFCYKCHGPSTVKGGLRVDSAAAILKGGDGGKAIKPGKPDDSPLYQMMITDESDLRMPPKGPRPTKQELEKFKQWIDQGAKMPGDKGARAPKIESSHWSFQPIVRPNLPDVKRPEWARNEIDRFVLARLEEAKVAPSPEADRNTLIRRLSLDLLGLPPSPEEVDAWLADDRPDAYERLVDRLLASPHYGERWGRHWLDVARYADSHGFTIDGARSIWKYRDWVIDALNRDLPFDQFTIEQIAGDMLPQATPEQIVATGFHRNTLINQEGGTDAEQFRVESIVDRVGTTATVYLGLTIACAQCHSHKFDPITQREFYQLYAFLNNADEPNLPLPSPDQAQKQTDLKESIASAEKQLKEYDAAARERQVEWEKQLAAQTPVEWTVLDASELKSDGGAMFTQVAGGIVMVGGTIPDKDTYTLRVDAPLEKITGLRLEVLTTEILPLMGPGLAADGNFVLSELAVATRPLARDDKPGVEEKTKSKPAAIARGIALHSPKKTPIEQAFDGKPATGWSIGVEVGTLNVDRSAVFLFKEDLAAAGQELEITLKQLHGAKHNLGRFRLSVTSAPRERLAVPEEIKKLVAEPADQREENARELIAAEFARSDSQRQEMAAKIVALKKETEQLAKSITTTMVMRERPAPRETFVQIRGDFLRPGDRVTPGVPDVLHPLPDDVKNPNRLDLARWLVDPANPLTPRVTVNRIWQQHFRVGLVETENDFGLQGAAPTHPELLDWLANEFVVQKWSMKALHKLIVSSATYRQASHARPDLHETDPRNKLLARQERVRLEAEVIRDVGLSASGLLSGKIGGPSVFPPQPAGLYKFTQNDKNWKDSAGEDRYRRGMYTHFWRSSPYPFLATFDAPEGNVTCTRRVRSNTPLQALTLANDRSLGEIAQGLAARALALPSSDDAARLELVFRHCMARSPNEVERSRLAQFHAAQRAQFAAAPAMARQVAAIAPLKGKDPVEAASWTAVARVLMNLDEFITRE